MILNKYVEKVSKINEQIDIDVDGDKVTFFVNISSTLENRVKWEEKITGSANLEETVKNTKLYIKNHVVGWSGIKVRHLPYMLDNNCFNMKDVDDESEFENEIEFDQETLVELTAMMDFNFSTEIVKKIYKINEERKQEHIRKTKNFSRPTGPKADSVGDKQKHMKGNSGESTKAR